MLFKINPQIFKDFPGVKIGVVAAHGIDNEKTHKEIQNLLKKQQEQLVAYIKLDELKDHPHIQAWREAYKKFGAKPKKYFSSIENLTQRILKGGTLGSINPLVDLYNVISLKYLLPAGGKNFAAIKGDIELMVAGENETPIVLLGESEARAPQAGEVIYKDNNGAICRRWNWKEVDRTKLTADTTDAFLVLEVLPPVNEEYLRVAINELAFLIEKYCGGTVTIAFLDENNPEIVLQKNNMFVPLEQKQDLDFSKSPFQQDAQIQAPIDEHEISGEHKVRLEKVEKMRQDGFEPWPEFKPVNATCKDILDEYGPEKQLREYHIAGRVVAMREHGKTAFAHIQDRSGKVQIYIKKDEVGEERFNFLNSYLDIGDIIWCKGHSFVTKMGEITLKVKDFTLLSKCLYPLPEKFHGLADVETKYRQRYLDLISNEESRNRFKKRSKVIRIMRAIFDSYDFMEVETPMLHPIAGGAAAKPFETHHNALDMTLYLRIAPELYLKRLVIGGFERVYEINRCFRNEGISTRHNPEFTMVEWYTAHHDYHWVMDFAEDMIRRIIKEVNGTMHILFADHAIDFEKPFARLTMQEAVAHYSECSMQDLEPDKIDMMLERHAISLANKDATWGQKLFALFEILVEPRLIQPTFITEFPVDVSPLAKRNPNNPNLVNRYELFIGGMELSNGFNELNDPFDQAQRFKDQLEARHAGDEEAHEYDADFIYALEHGLPPTVGAGIGIDRLVMLLGQTTSIKDVILFPTLKKK